MKKRYYFYCRTLIDSPIELDSTRTCIKPELTDNYKHLEDLFNKGLIEAYGYTDNLKDI